MKRLSAVRLLTAALVNASYLLVGPSVAQAQYATPADIPAEVFAALPQVSNLRQSPNGEKVAFMSSIQGRKVVIIQNLDGSDRYIQPPSGDADISHFFWANDERLLVVYEVLVVRAEYTGFKNTETRLIAVNADGSKLKPIILPSKIRNSADRNRTHPNPMYQNNIIDLLPDEPNHILVSLDADFDNRAEVRKVDIRNGKFRQIHDGFRGVQSWSTDSDNELRFGWGTDRGKWVGYWRNADDDWKQVTNEGWFKNYGVHGLDGTADHMVIAARTTSGTSGVFRLNIPSGKIVEELFAHEKVDVDNVLFNRSRSKIVGVRYTTDLPEYHFIDKKRAGLHRAMKRALAGYNVRIDDFDHAAGRYLLFAYNDREPGVYYQYDRKAKKLIEVVPSHPDVPSEMMANTSMHSITARDGTEIPAFLTLPVGAEPENLPAVVLVHGGPNARDDARWDYWTQFLASRGYAVLRPNFRGSDGYGPAFRAAGYNQWGGRMQQDVADATQQLINDGTFDPDRICIAGASYGGYAAMMGIIQTPDLFQCGVSVNGAVNIPRLKNADAAYYGTKVWRSRMGLKDTPDEAISPYHMVEQINQPVLIMASKDDTRLKIVDSENFQSRLKSKGKDSQFIKIDDGGHHMDTAASRLTMMKAMESFLAEHIGQ